MTRLMHAITATAPGGPEVLSWEEVPAPEPGPGDVLIDVAATAVNRADLLQRQGLYPPPPGVTDIIGLECSGTIVGLGAGVTGHKVGDQVVGLLSGGGYAEQVIVPSGQVMSVPSPVSLVDAAALPEVACTVWSNLAMVGHMRQGDWLLIHGAGSGVGTMAIQIAKAMGVRIAVTAGSEKKLQTCAALGAEVLINYHEQDFASVVMDVTAGRGVDLILDNMGASYLERNIAALARNGRLLIIGFQGGVKAEVDLSAMLRKNATVHAMSLRGRPTEEKSEVCRQVEKNVWPWIGAGLVGPVIDRRLAMSEAATAHRLLADGEVTGKILLVANATS